MEIFEKTLNFEKKISKFGQGKNFLYDKNSSIGKIVELQAERHPEKIAVKYQAQNLTYQQLNAQANRLAYFFLQKGIQKNSTIAIYLEPGLELIVTILAVLKSGGVYLTLDINYPVERLNYMLKDSHATLLITQSFLSNKLHLTDIDLIQVDTCYSTINKESSNNPPCLVMAEDPAYIIYTSGSTGTPKGIIVPHRAINNHMAWMWHHFKFMPTDIVLLKTPVSFDPSVWEIFLPFYGGAQLVVAPTGFYLDPHSLLCIINEYRVTTIQFVPTLLHQFLEQNEVISCPSLRQVFVGGESLRAETKRLFFERLQCQLHNLYGPAETTIEITSHTINPSDFDINNNIIGKPIYNTQLYVVNDKGKLCEIDEEGELYVEGDSLSKGYYNNEKATQEKFIENPFGDNDTTLYKTGDIVKWLENGNLVYIGRNNEQIKINGVRIEPSEIISYILRDTHISNCVVTKKVDSYGYPFLACYIAPKKDEQIDVSEVKERLKNFFPGYMLPKTYTLLDTLPLTTNGKINILALPEPHILSHRECKINLGEDINEEERKLLSIWRKLMRNDNIKLNDNFFEIGGNSLLAFQLLLNIKAEFPFEIRIKDIFLYPSISEQANLINQLKKEAGVGKDKKMQIALQNSMIPLQSKGKKAPLFLIHPIGGTVFWYFKLAHLLGNSHPVYGIQDPAIELEEPIFSTIEEMADAYITLIQKIQPVGPYLLGGASFGSTVAVEMANRLKDQGQETLFVAILDGWAVYPNTLLDSTYFKESMEKQHAVLKAEFEKYNLPEPSNLFAIQWHRLSLLWKYHLEKIVCPIVLFKSEEILPAFKEIDSPLNHWEKFTEKPILSYLVPGNHETMFQAPHVQKLSNYLSQSLLALAPN